MSELSKVGKKLGFEEKHLTSVNDFVGVITGLPAEIKDKAVDIALSAAGVDITKVLDRLPNSQKLKVMAWAMRQGQK